VSRWSVDAYEASLPDMPLDELCARLRGQYPNGAKYGASPLQAEAARRLEELDATIDDMRT